MTDELRTLDSYREEIEANPGKLVFENKDGIKFRPYYQCIQSSWWHGINAQGLSDEWPGNRAVWRPVKPVVVKYLWAVQWDRSDKFYITEKKFLTQEETEKEYDRAYDIVKLVWSRTELPAEEIV